MSVRKDIDGPLLVKGVHGTEAVTLPISRANPHSLVVDSSIPENISNGAIIQDAEIVSGDRTIPLGNCRVEVTQSSVDTERRLVLTEDIVDFRSLDHRGIIIPFRQKFAQLSLFLEYKRQIRPAFREYTADLIYDLQVFRGLFDEIEAGIQGETFETREEIRRIAIDEEGERFLSFLDKALVELETLVRNFAKQEHERHGFYFRKHIRDVSLTSKFLARTNSRPRGYAGDSVLMRWIYENEYRGPTIFARLMHKHPVLTAAAQAVRNRRELIAKTLHEARKNGAENSSSPLRFMSVACGPAWELRDVFSTPADVGAFSVALLDQDTHALAEARDGVREIAERLGEEPEVTYVRGSVRTMLRDPDLAKRWGHFDLVYSMGLFDYLTRPVAEAVLRKLYSLLNPGGRLIIGNFHVGNPTRTYMEYWMDWVLLHRTSQQMLDLASVLPDVNPSISFEPTGSQMFLEVTRS